MVVGLLFIGIICGVAAASFVWITGYGIGAIALAYWSAGSAALLLCIIIRVWVGEQPRQYDAKHQTYKTLRRTN